MRTLYDLARLEGTKPGATVLATLSDRADAGKGYPLIAWQRYGSGKVLFVGTDQLWRLRFRRGDEHHARFWGQAIRFLTLSRLLGENKRIRLETERKTYRAGERVGVSANVLDDGFNPVRAGAHTVFVESVPPEDEPWAVVLKPVTGTPGLYQGFLTCERAGTYRVQTAPLESAFSNEVVLQVTEASREQWEPAMQRERLARLAERSGGRLLSAGDLPGLPSLLRAEPRTVVLPPQETELWDHAGVFLRCSGSSGRNGSSGGAST